MSVAIVGYRNAGDIVRCLEALTRSTYANFNVIICENGGPAAFEALCEAMPERLAGGQPVRAVLAPRNLGYAGGLNVCFRESPGADAWWVLNPDTAPYPEAMARLVARLAVGDCDAAGCTVHLPDGKVQSYGGRWGWWLARAVSIGHGTPLDAPVDAARIERLQNYLNGAAMMISRHFLEGAGPPREEYFLYCEEVEWCLRAVGRGLRLGFAPDALVLHYQGTATGNEPVIARRARLPIYLNERNKILLTRDLARRRLPVAAVAAFATLFLRYGRRGAWRQLGFGMQGWLAGLMDERGEPRAA